MREPSRAPTEYTIIRGEAGVVPPKQEKFTHSSGHASARPCNQPGHGFVRRGRSQFPDLIPELRVDLLAQGFLVEHNT